MNIKNYLFFRLEYFCTDNNVSTGKSLTGFTLIEVTIVLSLILLIATISIPSLLFLNQQVVVSDLEKLNMIFPYLQQCAVSSNKNITLKFDPINHEYSFENQKVKLSRNVEFGIKNEIKGSPASASKNINSPISFVNNQTIFYSTGKIQPGSVYLIDSAKKYLYALTVPVSQISFIRKYRYENGKWLLI